MKRSLNNRFKGKRLVTGDENEINAHELLLKEEDNKIVVKGRGESGNVEVLSGGSNKGTEFNISYYIKGSGVPLQTEFSTYTSLEDFISKDISKPDIDDINTSLCAIVQPVESSKVTISKEKGYNYENITINVKELSSELVSNNPFFFYNLTRNYYHNGTAVDNTLSAVTLSPTNKSYFFDFPLIYDAKSNILIYYTSASNCYVHISPESLSKTLKCYCKVNRNYVYLPEGATLIDINE